MTEHGNSQEETTEPEDVGRNLMQLVAWFAIAAVVGLVVALCVLIIYLMTSG